MKSLPTLLQIVSTAFLTAGSALADKNPAEDVEGEFHKKIKPLLQDYCYDCHGDGSDKGDFTLDEFESTSALLHDQKVWLRIWENLRTEMMPPAKKESQPTSDERRELVSWIEKQIFKLDPKNPDPGRVTIRRMNREEYQNTIADVVGVRFSANDNFPSDDTGFGFDTIGDVLTISPLLMEKYLSAAEEIAGLALPLDAGVPKPIEIDAGNFKDGGGSQTARFMEADIAQTVVAKRRLDAGAKYSLEISYSLENEGGRPKGQTAKWQIIVDGEPLREIEIDSDKSRRDEFVVDLELAKGEHRFEFSIVPGNKGEGDGTAGVRVDKFRLKRLELESSWDLYPESYQRIFVKGLPSADKEEQAVYMREIVESFAMRTFRRPARKKLVDQITALALSKTREEGVKFADGVRLAVTATLASPSFLFRSEVQAEPDNPGKVVLLDEYALASRLSYFLWSSAPDAALLDLAAKGKLRSGLRGQVDRMLADEKGSRMVENFVGQWLQARDLSALSIDARRILGERDRSRAERVFNSGTRKDMKTETEEFFRHVLVDNRPLLELLNANYSFLNENLANFYGVPGVRGDEFRKVEFNENAKGRGGLLGQGTFLIVTSQSTRTSPVKRGLFVLDNILGTPAPPAPPNIPELEETQEKLEKGATMRQLMEVHREKVLCASCHERMDPIGLALENFNALGQWRDQEDGKEIDSAGKLVTGEKFTNVMELKSILATSRKQDFYRCLTEKLLTYALGRGVEYYDAPTVDAIMAQLVKEGGGMKDLIYAVTESVPFQKRRGDGDSF
ncbi:MAG: DUF1592 domain-containing protein [Akkermansiaceae bacterium]|jgi:hypothetical protein